MASESAREISECSDSDLAYALRYQQSRGEHTWGPGLCGHYARGAGFCESCVQAEIDRRAVTGGDDG